MKVSVIITCELNLPKWDNADLINHVVMFFLEEYCLYSRKTIVPCNWPVEWGQHVVLQELTDDWPKDT